MPSKNSTQGTSMDRSYRAIALIALALGCTLATPSQAATDGKASTAKTAKKKSIKVHAPRSTSEESAAERDRRLYRECKGMPNAGACLGYTRK